MYIGRETRFVRLHVQLWAKDTLHRRLRPLLRFHCCQSFRGLLEILEKVAANHVQLEVVLAMTTLFGEPLRMCSTLMQRKIFLESFDRLNLN